MKLPRDLSGNELEKALSRLGYAKTRQVGSHMRLTTEQGGEHNITVPAHDPLKIGTLNAILKEVGDHHGLTRKQLLQTLFH